MDFPADVTPTVHDRGNTSGPHHRSHRQRTPKVPPGEQRPAATKVTPARETMELMRVMHDRELSMGCVIAWTLWVLSGVILIFSIAVWDDTLAFHLGRVSTFLCGAAVTATVRSYFVTHNRIVRSVLAVRDSVDEPIRAVR